MSIYIEESKKNVIIVYLDNYLDDKAVEHNQIPLERKIWVCTKHYTWIM